MIYIFILLFCIQYRLNLDIRSSYPVVIFLTAVVTYIIDVLINSNSNSILFFCHHTTISE